MSLIKTPFTQMFIKTNRIDPGDFQGWIFSKEMLFTATGKWWGDFGQRDFPHEGLDFCLYADCGGKICQLEAPARIPVMYDGVVKAVFKDYLGQAVIIEHTSPHDREHPFLSAYAHTIPVQGIKAGLQVMRGDVIATIADTRSSKAKILPHLHFSIGRPTPKLVYEGFRWNIMRDPELITLRDPLDFIDCPHRVAPLDAIGIPGGR